MSHALLLQHTSCCLLILALLVLVADASNVVSFTANGLWGPPPATISNETVCVDKLMCTPGNLTWIPSYTVPSTPGGLFTNDTACQGLIDKGITKIYFHGDSYMRQIYAAMLITLKGDYRGGSLQNATRVPECTYHRQFNEKRCGTRDLNHYGVVCGGKVILEHMQAGFHDFNLCSQTNGSVVLWSFGNYKLAKGGRFGVNNASAYAEFFEAGICKHLTGPAYVQQILTKPIGKVGICSAVVGVDLPDLQWWFASCACVLQYPVISHLLALFPRILFIDLISSSDSQFK